jgi:UDP:flavonoid glycosyltransferase YjiC (YdhE family)
VRLLLAPQAGALGLGGISRCLALAEVAQVRGHRVAFLAPPRFPLLDEYRYGTVYSAVRPDTSHSGAGEARTFVESLTIRGMLDPNYLEAAVRAERAAIAEFRPDVIVTENQISIPISARLTDTPFAATIATINLTTFNATAARSRTPDEVAFVKFCADKGLVHVDSVYSALHGTADLNLAPTIPRLEPALSTVPAVRFVGPIMFPPLELRPCPYPPCSAERTRVLVYLSRGLVTIEGLLPELRAAFGPDRYDILVACPADTPPHDYAPGVQLLPLPGLTRGLQACDIFITRGGQNAVMAALLAGQPIVGTPGSSAEPLFNLRMVEAAGAAAFVPGLPTAAQLRDAALAVNTSHARAQAGVLGDELRQHGGATEAVQALESLV